jgi:hypothetical protein
MSFGNAINKTKFFVRPCNATGKEGHVDAPGHPLERLRQEPGHVALAAVGRRRFYTADTFCRDGNGAKTLPEGDNLQVTYGLLHAIQP